MATFAEDRSSAGVDDASAQLVARRGRYQRTPGGRVVIVDAQGIVARSTRTPRSARATLARGRPEIAHGARGQHRHRHAALEHARHRPDLRRRAGRLGRRVRGARAHHLSDVGARRAGDAATGCCSRRSAASCSRPRPLVGLRFARTLTRAALGARARGGRGRRRATSTARAPGRQRAARGARRRGRASTRRWRGSTRCSARSRSSSPTPRTSCGRRSPRCGCGSRTSSGTSSAAGRRDLDAALAEVERLARLVDGLLALARADAASSGSRRRSTCGSSSATRVDALAAAGRRHAASRSRPACQPSLRALATPGALEQVLDNLLSNALAVSPRGVDDRRRGARWRRRRRAARRRPGPGMTAEQRRARVRPLLARRAAGRGNRARARDRPPARQRRRRHDRAARGRRRRPRRARSGCRAAERPRPNPNPRLARA